MKEFDTRNGVKKELCLSEYPFFVREREIWYAHLGVNVGFEEDGKGKDFKGPVLVLKKVGNMFVVLPMTTKGTDSRFYYRLPDFYFSRTSRVILSQIRVLDKARFIERMSRLEPHDFFEVKKRLKALLQ